MSSEHILPGIGSGWWPAVLNTPRESDFIREGQRTLFNSVPYWIDAHTTAQPNDTIQYSNFSANFAGNIAVK